MQWKLVARRKNRHNIKTANAVANNFVSPPDAQVEEQILILREPEVKRPSGTETTTTTNHSTARDKEETNGILQEQDIITGWHCIRDSPFATCDNVSPRNQATTTTKSSEHLHRARPFAAAKEESSNPSTPPPKQARQED